jgi:hypothetical protein
MSLGYGTAAEKSMDCFASLAMTNVGAGNVTRPSLPATNAERLCKGAKRRSNPSIRYAAPWIASLRSQ